jgi:hypothetical protein
MRNIIAESDDYEKRVRAYERKGCTRSDAQGIVDAEDMNKSDKFEQWIDAQLHTGK